MFGGIVETVGVVQAVTLVKDCKQFTISPQKQFDDLKIGDSIAINGVCLTVTAVHPDYFNFTAVPETLALTTLGKLQRGSIVNLERALKVNERIGGHYVQGHIDGIGELAALEEQGAAWLVTIKIAPRLAQYVVKKGYVAVDGMSLTVVEEATDQFSVVFIPHTQAATIVKAYCLGTQLNIEVDIVGKYVEKFLVRASA